MFLSNAAVLLLGAMQPALGKPTANCAYDGGARFSSTSFTRNQTIVSFIEPESRCPLGEAMIGVWPADFKNPSVANAKAKAPLPPSKGCPATSAAKFNDAELGDGEFKAIFFCNDGSTQPWIVADAPFTVVPGPPRPAKRGECAHRSSDLGGQWMYSACKGLNEGVCEDCGFGQTCNACNECKEACGKCYN
ncbi:uncharacterized protein MAM_06609 [Metarhizium album ARSEF 1941]|uniref:Uncharacterized protein n=1 Tax=Metarhizium album (strain ARSEF 1941) TaxID=1081103 RepID=A0A0B2WPY8_METAS|nr:uncharacterized protein MAM_06609 [Metarhizium album ARSEF 1941]KHN95552.1 hypothetical protein MAM_06609 [Metarhizium album ARSEF 1941]